MSSQLGPEAIERGRAYLRALHGKIERKEELSLREKRYLLHTGKLPYKALTFPESLTPAERNRILRMPPPDEVTANIKRVTNGAMSTSEEMYQAALDNAEAMTDDQLQLIALSFYLSESIYETTPHLRWSGKLGKAGDLAFNAIIPKHVGKAHHAVHLVGLDDLSSERFAAYQARVLAAIGPLDTPEKHTAWAENNGRQQELAAEKARQWDEYDVKLLTEAKESMVKMADELEGEVCYCELCTEFCGWEGFT